MKLSPKLHSRILETTLQRSLCLKSQEPETSPISRASQSKRLAPGLAEEVSRGESLPPRRFTIFSKR